MIDASTPQTQHSLAGCGVAHGQTCDMPRQAPLRASEASVWLMGLTTASLRRTISGTGLVYLQSLI